MLNRYSNQMSRGNSSFADWMEQQKLNENAGDVEEQIQQGGMMMSMFGQIGAIQENFGNQLSELSGNLPDAGPLSAAFRTRVKHSMYLLFAALIFGALAILVGLPTLVLRPSKFVICMTLSTLCAAASVIVLQKPSAFVAGLFRDGPVKALPIVVLLISTIATVYVTIFVHRYLFVIIFGGLQVLCMLWYLSSFVPGGPRGLQVLLKMGYALAKTALTPCIFCARKSIQSFLRTVMS
jgi:hypothetical protein